MTRAAKPHLQRGVIASLVIVWFVSMSGGWPDIGSALGAKPWAESTGELKVRNLTAERILLEGEGLGMPTHLVVDGDELLVVDRYRGEAVFVVDRSSGRVLRSFGRRGEGPGEFKSPVSLVVSEADVAVLDAGLNRITWLGQDPGSSEFHLTGTVQIATESVVTDFVIAADKRFLVAGFLGGGRLAQIDQHGAFLRYVGEPVHVDNLPPDRRSEVFQGSLRSGGSMGVHVLTSRFASRIDIFDAGISSTVSVWGPRRFEPHPGRYESRFGYLDSAPMSDGFLALYSGRTREEYPGRANYGAIIDEFGWDGTHRARYELDADVITIAWSEPDRRLYAVRHDPIPAILVYTIGR